MGDPLNDVLMLAEQLGAAYRGDWNDFDGRTLRDQMIELREVASGSVTIEGYRSMNMLCPHGGGHWTDYCSDHKCGEATDA